MPQLISLIGLRIILQTELIVEFVHGYFLDSINTPAKSPICFIYNS